MNEILKPYGLPNSDNLNIFKLFYSDYVIFLTAKFFNNYWFNFKKSLLTYFDKYDVIYFNYNNKNKIIDAINSINSFIKNSGDNANELLILDNSKKIKQIFFSECIFEPDILYKKINFSNQEIFIPFNNYVIKKMEYKLRTFCQIAEKLGAEKIVIDYLATTNEESAINANINIFSEALGANINSNNNRDENIQIIFEYPNNHSDINLAFPTEANEVFATFPRNKIEHLNSQGYTINEDEWDGKAVRLVAAWNTKDNDVDNFLEILKQSN